MTKHQRPRDFQQPAPPPCRVADLAHRFAEALRQWNLVDGAAKVADAMDFNEMQMSALTEAAVFDQPTSPVGALFQVLVASGEAEALSDYADQAGGSEERKAARKHDIRLQTALWGVRRFLETHFGISGADTGGEYMMSEPISYSGKLAAAAAAAERQREAPGPLLAVAN